MKKTINVLLIVFSLTMIMLVSVKGVLEGDISVGINNTFISGDQIITTITGTENGSDVSFKNENVTNLNVTKNAKVQGNFSVDIDDTFFVDTTNNSVGIGTEFPRFPFTILHVPKATPPPPPDRIEGIAQIAKHYTSVDIGSAGDGSGDTPAKSSYLHLGGEEKGVDSHRILSFGWKTTVSAHFPAYIGYVEKISTGNTNGDLIFGTRTFISDREAPERMRIANNGLIGIGKTIPNSTLDVHGNINSTSVTTGNANVTNRFHAVHYLTSGSELLFNFYDDGTDIFMNVSNGGGDFAIEQDNSKLVLFNEPKSANDFKVLQVFSKEATDVSEFVVSKAGINRASYFIRSLCVGVREANCSKHARHVTLDTDVKGSDVFIANDLEVNNTLYIGENTLIANSTSGNVGIGLINPTSKLHVVGNVNLNNTLVVEDNTVIVNGSETVFSAFSNNAFVVRNKSGGIVFQHFIDGDGDGLFSVRDKTGAIKVQLHGASDSFFTGGDVGIGISSPIAKLHVGSGSASTTIMSSANNDGIFVDTGVLRGMVVIEGSGSGEVIAIDAGATANQRAISLVSDSQFGHIRAYNDGFGTRKNIMTFDLGSNVGRVGIGTTTPSFPLTVMGNTSSGGSAISIWVEANVSARGYITRTSVFDKSQNALDFIQDADYYKSNGKIVHSKFYGYVTYSTTDLDRPVLIKKNNTYFNETDKSIIIDFYNETTYPYTKQEEGVELGAEIDVLRQALYEIKLNQDLVIANLTAEVTYLKSLIY